MERRCHRERQVRMSLRGIYARVVVSYARLCSRRWRESGREGEREQSMGESYEEYLEQFKIKCNYIIIYIHIYILNRTSLPPPPSQIPSKHHHHYELQVAGTTQKSCILQNIGHLWQVNKNDAKTIETTWCQAAILFVVSFSFFFYQVFIHIIFMQFT